MNLTTYLPGTNDLNAGKDTDYIVTRLTESNTTQLYNKKLENIPKILETPYIEGFPPYKYEIEMIKNKTFDKDMIEKIRNNK